VRSLIVTLGLLVGVLPAFGALSLNLPPALPVTERAAFEQLASQADVATRVEAEPFVIRTDVFEYLLDHPDFATDVAGALRLTRFRMWSTPDGLFLDDGRGLTGQFRLVYAATGTRLFHARGEYNNAVLPTIHGQALTMIEYDTSPVPDGRALIRPAVSGAVRLDNRLAAFGFRVLSEVAQRKADREARRLMKLFARASRALDESPEAVLESLCRQPGVPARELEEFARLLTER
jgi:hypothetical protein